MGLDHGSEHEMTMSNGQADSPNTPRSMRSEDRTSVERLATLEEWLREIDSRIVADAKRRDSQHADRTVAQQHLASEVVALRSAVARIEDAVGQLQTDLAAISAAVSSGARQIVQVQQRLGARQIATYAVGVGGAGALYEAGKALIQLVIGGLQ